MTALALAFSAPPSVHTPLDHLLVADAEVRAARDRLRIALRETFLEPSWLLALARLQRVGRRLTTAEFERLCLHEINGRYAVVKLETRGLVAIERSEFDARQRFVRLTEEGLKLVHRLERLVEEQK